MSITRHALRMRSGDLSSAGATNLARRESVGSSSPRKQPERQLHKAVAEFLDASLPAQAFWWPTPNASKRNKIQAANMKRAREFKPGIPDIFVLYRGKLIGIELKAGKGSTTDTQDDVHQLITLAGGIVYVARSLEGVAGALLCMMPLKGRVI